MPGRVTAALPTGLGDGHFGALNAVAYGKCCSRPRPLIVFNGPGGIMNTKGGMWIVLALCCLGRLIAQSTFGEIRGTVTDPTGAVVVGATVTATNTGTGDL